jgi:hypothetical protein
MIRCRLACLFITLTALIGCRDGDPPATTSQAKGPEQRSLSQTEFIYEKFMLRSMTVSWKVPVEEDNFKFQVLDTRPAEGGKWVADIRLIIRYQSADHEQTVADVACEPKSEGELVLTKEGSDRLVKAGKEILERIRPK